jgi:hypothetical protein
MRTPFQTMGDLLVQSCGKKRQFLAHGWDAAIHPGFFMISASFFSMESPMEVG